MVGVGENSADTIESHDTYNLGEFKDDQLQKITGYINNIASYSSTGSVGSLWKSGGTSSVGGSGTGNFYTINFDSSRTARSGTVTRGKSKGVNFIIRF